MKRFWKRHLPIACFVIMLGLVAIVTVPVNAEVKETDTIPERVYADQISVGGMTQDEAVQAVEEYVAGLQDRKVTLKAGNNELEVTAGELGISWSNPEIIEEAAGLGKSGNLISRYKAAKDLENEDKVYQIAYNIDREKAVKILEDNGSALNTEAVNAGLKRENGSFSMIPGSQGVTVNVEESLAAMEKYFVQEWNGNDAAVELAADVVEPKGTEEELAKVKDLLGSFQTSYSTSGAGRSQNVANGTSKINGSVIYPGEEFSVYETISPFDAENGYELAGSYANGTTVESFGGGICQVSTTLYNAIIRAELEVTERFNHSMIVGYVDPSADAAIAGTYKDLKFKNNTDAPIYIEGYTADKVVYFNVFGQETRDSGRKVSFVSETLSTTDPGVQYKAAPDQPIGYIAREQSAHVGYVAQLWKVVTVNGVEESREIFNKSTYKPSPKIVVVGTASANGEAVAAMNAAIGTQDEATINIAASQWNDAAIAAQQAAQQAAQEEEQKDQAKEEAGDNQDKDGSQDAGADKGSSQDADNKEDAGGDNNGSEESKDSKGEQE